ncbi:MAG: hypothetical protein ACK5X3_05730 [Pseudomonadota bacterium]
MTVTQPTATIDAVATPPALTERGPLGVATALIANVPGQVSQAFARLVRADTEDVVKVREQGSAVKAPLVAGAVRARLQGSVGGFAQ